MRSAVLAVTVTAALGVAAPASGAPDPGAHHSLRADLTSENFYFVMADRFENGTTANDLGGYPDDKQQSGFDPTGRGWYHGGDLRGIIKRLDYIKGLGTTAIWLTPSFKNRPVQPVDNSAGYHGYWITDFTQIDPHLGTNDDLAELVDRAHARGMKVFFDIITNHTADVIQYTEGARMPYASKDRRPYTDASGKPFDDRDFAGTGTFPPLDANSSFPYHPFVPAGLPRKVPEWLNDVSNYHNRGDTTFVGEDSQYGDFFGLDDLFTEKPEVVQGMIDIYETWIRDFHIDGFRIDTMKHVNDEFWQRFGPEVLQYAREHGVPRFFMFGEVANDPKTPEFFSHYSTHDEMQSVLDFGFQGAARAFVAANGSARALSDFFRTDDWYTDADSNAYQLPTFLGNHDMGRFGLFVDQGNPGAAQSERLARDRLGHALMYFSRGNPVVYYGDEQGFVGDGGDQLARQDMFPSKVPEYNDDDLIGTAATTATSNFDRGHPLYRTIARLARFTKAHPALRDGAQQDRYADDGPGVYAFSRIDRDEQVEYVVAVNNAESRRDVAVPTFAAGARFKRIFPTREGRVRTDARRRLQVSVPRLQAVVYKAVDRLAPSPAAPDVAITSAAPSDRTAARVEVRADVAGTSFYEVTFQAKVGDGDWQDIGTDDNAPYRVFHDVEDVPAGTPLAYRAIVLDNAGHTRAAREVTTTAPLPRIHLLTPAGGDRVRGTVSLLARTDPENSDQAVRFERRVAGGDWTAVKTDDSSPDFAYVDDISGLGLADGDTVAYRAVLIDGSGNEVVSDTRTLTVAVTPVTTLVVHYFRPDGSYADWGLHLFGDGLAPGTGTDWGAPRGPTGIDEDGARFEIPIANDTVKACFIIHKPGGDQVPSTREPGGDQCVVPLAHPEVWMTAGDPAQHYTDPTP